MRRTLIALVVAVIGYAIWQLDSLLQTTIWMRPDPAKMVTGWSILLAAWPLTLAGVVVGGGVSLFMIMMLYMFANRSDHKREVRQLQDALETLRRDVQQEMAERERIAIDMTERAREQIQLAREKEMRTVNDLAMAYSERDRAIEAATRTRYAYERKQKQLEKALKSNLTVKNIDGYTTRS